MSERGCAWWRGEGYMSVGGAHEGGGVRGVAGCV